jgi:hypothetical protein
MNGNQTLESMWQHVDGLYQIVTELIELQRITAEKQQQSAQQATETDENAATTRSIVEQLDQLQRHLVQQRAEARQLAEKPTFAASTHMTELSVERLNVTEADGTLRLVLCNAQRSPGHVMDGEVYGEPEGQRWAGLYFFTEEGNECGGLIYSGKREADGSYQTGGILTFDQYRQDQVICFQHGDGNGQRFSSIHMWDRPDLPLNEWVKQFGSIWDLPSGPEKEAAIQQLRAEGQLAAQRLFVGKEINRAPTVRLHDGQGRVRLRLSVAEDGAAAIEFLDEEGQAINRFSGAEAGK